MDIDGAKLKRLRDERALTLRDLSELSGVDYTAISEIERGQRKPHQSTVRKLATALGIQVRELLRDE